MKNESTREWARANNRRLEHFVPPRCPRNACPSNAEIAPFRYRRNGTYLRACDNRRIPRFRCMACGRGFSAQSFRLDYRLQKPQLLSALLDLFVSKVTLRQASRLTGAHLDTVARIQRLLGEHSRHMQQSLLKRRDREPGTSVTRTLVLDELETFETSRIERPVTVAFVVDADSLFIFEMEVGSLPHRNPRGKRRTKRSATSTGHPIRKSGSRRAVRAALRRTADWIGNESRVVAISDRKRDYPAALKRAFGPRLMRHVTVDSKAPRTTSNPLFPVNLTLAMARDGTSRLVRRSWAHSKLRSRLRLHLWIWIAWRNWCRDRVVRSRGVTAAMATGLIDKKLQTTEFLGWHGRFATLAGRP